MISTVEVTPCRTRAVCPPGLTLVLAIGSSSDSDSTTFRRLLGLSRISLSSEPLALFLSHGNVLAIEELVPCPVTYVIKAGM